MSRPLPPHCSASRDRHCRARAPRECLGVVSTPLPVRVLLVVTPQVVQHMGATCGAFPPLVVRLSMWPHALAGCGACIRSPPVVRQRTDEEQNVHCSHGLTHLEILVARRRAVDWASRDAAFGRKSAERLREQRIDCLRPHGPRCSTTCTVIWIPARAPGRARHGGRVAALLQGAQLIALGVSDKLEEA